MRATLLATFHSLGLYWSPAQGSASDPARVEFRRELVRTGG
jgi:hypothetical protein